MLMIKVTPSGSGKKRIYGVILYETFTPWKSGINGRIIEKFGFLDKHEYTMLVKQFESIVAELNTHIN